LKFRAVIAYDSGVGVHIFHDSQDVHEGADGQALYVLDLPELYKQAYELMDQAPRCCILTGGLRF
jgi:hypothetical protein